MLVLLLLLSFLLRSSCPWDILRFRTTQMCQMFGCGWRPCHGAIELIYWNKIELWVRFPLPPVWGQSTSYRRRYAHFVWRVVRLPRERKLSRIKRMSVDDTALVSIDGDPSRRAKPISWPTWAHKLPQVTRVPLHDSKPYLCVFLSHCSWIRFIIFIVLSIRVGEKSGTPSESSCNSIFLVFIFYIYSSIIYVTNFMSE